MMIMRYVKEWECTHKGWFLLCPVYLSDVDSDCPTMGPRHLWFNWWFEFNIWLNDGINIIISLINPKATGFLISIEELPEPKTIRTTTRSKTLL